MSVVVFAGPTIAASDVVRILDCAVRPPARQGDLFRAVRDEAPGAIVLIDGVFREAPSVWHREILWALSAGVHVFGAASMGALRAAELHGFGMRGTGAVFEAYRDGSWPGFDEPFRDDDEVAVIHGPPELGSPPLSDAMVDLRATLRAAETDGVISRAERDRLVRLMKSLHYPERSFERLTQAAAAELRQPLASRRISRKRLDAVALLEAVRAHCASVPPPFEPPFRMERTLEWERFLQRSEAREGTSLGDISLVLDELRLDPARWREYLWAASGRRHALAAAPALPPNQHDPAMGRFRLAHGLLRQDDVQDWMGANAATARDVARLAREEASVSSHPAANGEALVDFLRVTGKFATLRAEAARKRSFASMPRTQAQTAAAVAWYVDTYLFGRRPASMEQLCVEFGWRNRGHFEDVVWCAYVDSVIKPRD